MPTAITIDSLALPENLVWTDRWAFSPIVSTITQTLDGGLVIENSIMQAGRPITLETVRIGDGYAGLFTEAEAAALKGVYEVQDDPQHTLTIGSESFPVRFNRTEGGLEIRPLAPTSAAQLRAGKVYSVRIRFITMSL